MVHIRKGTHHRHMAVLVPYSKIERTSLLRHTMNKAHSQYFTEKTRLKFSERKQLASNVSHIIYDM